jgi:hypothetical protein
MSLATSAGGRCADRTAMNVCAALSTCIQHTTSISTHQALVFKWSGFMADQGNKECAPCQEQGGCTPAKSHTCHKLQRQVSGWYGFRRCRFMLALSSGGS